MKKPTGKYEAEPLFGKPSEADPRWTVIDPEGKWMVMTVGGNDEKNAKLIAAALNKTQAKS